MTLDSDSNSLFWFSNSFLGLKSRCQLPPSLEGNQQYILLEEWVGCVDFRVALIQYL